MKKVLVAGATGYLGQYVVKEFKKQGYWLLDSSTGIARKRNYNICYRQATINVEKHLPETVLLCIKNPSSI